MKPLDHLEHLALETFRTPPAARTFLDARCQYALALALVTVDPVRAHFLATHAFGDVVNLAFDAPAVEEPWPVRPEPVLLFAFEKARELGLLWRALEDARRARTAAAAAQRDRRRKQEAEDRRRAEEDTPGAEAMLADLEAGKELDLNGHSLEWDEEMCTLAGTNPYGIDYFFGDMTLDTVARWRSAMLSGETIGQAPPGSDDSWWPEDEDYGDLGPAYEVHLDHQALQHMSDWVFTQDLRALVPADPSNS